MKSRWYFGLAASLFLLAVMFIASRMALAQADITGGDDTQPGLLVQTQEATVDDDPSATHDPTGLLQDDPQLLEPAAVTIVNDVVQVQGRLTAPNGTPINGTHNITVSIYDLLSGGVARCTDVDPLSVSNGLFTMSLDWCTADDFNGDALYMGIQVDTDPEMTPRQEIFAVPYAWALRPGAIVKGADSYVFFPGSALIKNLSTDTTRWDIQPNGAARIWGGSTTGTKSVYYSLPFPAVLYGQNVTVKQMTVYYKVSNASNGYIYRTSLYLQTDADSYRSIIDDITNRTSTTASSYSINAGSGGLSSDQGAVSLFFNLFFTNDTDYVDIGSIRLLLGHP